MATVKGGGTAPKAAPPSRPATGGQSLAAKIAASDKNLPKAPAKAFSGPGIDPKTGKSTVKADLAKASQASLAKLTSGQKLNAGDKMLLNIGNKPKAITTKTKTTTKPTTKPTKTTTTVVDNKPAAEEQVSPFPDSGHGGDYSTTAPAAPIKTAPIDTVVFIDDVVSDELITDLLFEDVGGQELLTIARSDTVNGQNVIYQPFKNLSILQETYNPTTLLMLQETSDKIFANYIIDLREKIPKVGSGVNGANYYLDLTTGEGVIELVNLKADEQVEVQIATAGIIYEVGI